MGIADDEALRRLALMASSSIVGGDIRWALDRIAALTAELEAARSAIFSEAARATAGIAKAEAALAERDKDAERWRYLRERNAWMRECLIQHKGYRSTVPGAPWEVWDEHEGWVVSDMPSDADAYPTMDAAIDAALAAQEKT